MNNSPNIGFYGWASASVDNGYAYVGLASGCSKPNIVGGIDKISLATHKISAHLTTTLPGTLGADIWGTPTFDTATGTIFVSTGNDTVIQPNQEAQLQLTPKDLSILSARSVPARLRVSDGDFGTTPTMVTTVSGRLLDVATDKDGYLFAFNRTNVSAGPLWATRLSTDASFSSAAFVGGQVYVGGSDTTIKGVAANGSVRSIDSSSGKIAWSYPMPGKVYSSISYDNHLVAADRGSELALLNARNGTAVWTYIANTSFQGAMTFAHGMLFAAGENGVVYAFGLYSSGAGTAGGGVHLVGSSGYLEGLRAVRPVRSG